MSLTSIVNAPGSRAKIYFASLALLLGAGSNSPAAPQEMKTALRLEQGAIPPVGGPFGCVADLDGKPYSSELVRNCLNLIAQTPYVLEAKTESTDLSDGTKIIDFVLKAKRLVTKELTFSADRGDLPSLQEWMLRNPNNLRPGSAYNAVAETATYQGIRQFYLGRGVLVGIVPTVRLEYSRGTASIDFEIIKGPSIPRQPEYFPYGPACQDEVKYMDWSDVDQFVPVPLVESRMKLRSLGECFASEFVKQDEEALSKLGIFRDATVGYSGPNGDRHVVVKLKGKPLTVAETEIRTFGAYSKCAQNHERDITLQPNETYLSTSARKSTEYLEKVCSGPDRWVEVSEEDELTDGGDLRVFFSVLAFPLQKVFVDGKKIN